MSKAGCNAPVEVECGVDVKVDVSKIIKYICIAGVLIVAIIFGTKCLNNVLKTTVAKS